MASISLPASRKDLTLKLMTSLLQFALLVEMKNTGLFSRPSPSGGCCLGLRDSGGPHQLVGKSVGGSEL